MTNISKRVSPGIAAYFEGLALLTGAALICVGAWCINHPAGLIVAGTVLIAGPIFHGIGVELERSGHGRE